jgi:hypothetical protein
MCTVRVAALFVERVRVAMAKPKGQAAPVFGRSQDHARLLDLTLTCLAVVQSKQPSHPSPPWPSARWPAALLLTRPHVPLWPSRVPLKMLPSRRTCLVPLPAQ